MDESDYPLKIETDRSGSRYVSYDCDTDGRQGRRGTRGLRHTTGVYTFNTAGEVLPPLFIFESKATHTEKYAIQSGWIKDLTTRCVVKCISLIFYSMLLIPFQYLLNEVTGKYGKQTLMTKNSFTRVKAKDGMDASLFWNYIRQVILPLCPNISNETILENGNIRSGPVILKTDSGPGRFKECKEHINFLEVINNLGLNIILSLPTGTSVHAELDQLFGV